MKNILILFTLSIVGFTSCKTSQNRILKETSIFVYEKKMTSDVSQRLTIILNLNINKTFSISESGAISPLEYDGTWKYTDNNNLLLECYPIKILSTDVNIAVPSYIVTILNNDKIKLYKNNKKPIILERQK